MLYAYRKRSTLVDPLPGHSCRYRHTRTRFLPSSVTESRTRTPNPELRYPTPPERQTGSDRLTDQVSALKKQHTRNTSLTQSPRPFSFTRPQSLPSLPSLLPNTKPEGAKDHGHAHHARTGRLGFESKAQLPAGEAVSEMREDAERNTIVGFEAPDLVAVRLQARSGFDWGLAPRYARTLTPGL